MCGIAGYFGTNEIPPERIERCLAALHHRGPDHAAHAHFVGPGGRHAYLLSTRLDIIDLDARANQPFADGGKTLAYNGELYNYIELRADLARRGEQFRTESDTEVLLRVLDRLGGDALDRCEGMWAFALYDESDGSLTLCRDRFGEKPLYLFVDETGTYFGSEPKCIFELLGRRLAVDLDHLRRYLVNGYKALYKTDHTFFVSLRELEPATRLRLDAEGRADTRSYWRPLLDHQTDLSRDDAVAGVRERLIRSVEVRLRADVPLAFCMSGGVDSVSLISIAKRVLDYDVHGFTIVNTDARYEERDLVEQAVAELGIRHTTVQLDTNDFLPRLRTLVRAHDAPVATITYFAHWLLMQSIAAQGYRVAVSGTAADELFTGYYDHHLAYLHEVSADPGHHAKSLAAWQKHVQPIVRNPYLRDPRLFDTNPAFRDHIFLNADEFSDRLRSPWLEPFAEQTYVSSLLRNRMLNELFQENVPVILHEDDLNAMFFSVENRSPYLDRALFEYSLEIPTRHLVRDGYAKAVLRDAMRGVAPDAVLDTRRKVGFNAPIHALLDVRDPEVRSYLLDDGPIFEHVRKEPIAALLDRDDLPNSESKFLFSFVNCKIFLEEFAG